MTIHTPCEIKISCTAERRKVKSAQTNKEINKSRFNHFLVSHSALKYSNESTSDDCWWSPRFILLDPHLLLQRWTRLLVENSCGIHQDFFYNKTIQISLFLICLKGFQKLLWFSANLSKEGERWTCFVSSFTCSGKHHKYAIHVHSCGILQSMRLQYTVFINCW